MITQSSLSRIHINQRRLALVDKLAAASRRMMFAAGVDSATFTAIKSECTALRAEICGLRRYANLFFFDMDQSKLLLCEDDAGTPYGSCSSCPLIRFGLVLVGSQQQNITEFKHQFDLHFQLVHRCPLESSPK